MLIPTKIATKDGKIILNTPPIEFYKDITLGEH